MKSRVVTESADSLNSGAKKRISVGVIASVQKSDQQLLLEISSGSESAMEEFYTRHGSAVYQFSFKIVNNHSDAAEALNEVMFEVWNKSSSFESRSKVTTWLFSITHHKTIDLIRKKSRYDYSETMDLDRFDDNKASLSAALSMACDAQHVRACVSSLPVIHRQVIHLVFFEGFSYSEVSAVLDIPTGTVKTRVMHAKDSLKKMMIQSPLQG